jgi:hypothetical protein
MLKRAISAFAISIALSQSAAAGVPLFGHVSCAVVRFYVAKYSEPAAERWARSHGASESDIETARRCLHGASVQTASLPAKSQVPAPVAEKERAQHEPAERNPDQDALNVVPVQGQRADPEQDNHDHDPADHGLVRPKDVEDRFAGHVSNETGHVSNETGHVSNENKDLAPSDRKTTTLHPRYSGAMHRADGARWLKRLWNQLTRPRQFNVAFFQARVARR